MQVFLQAPMPASGPPPPDVAAFFPGPYFEWWNMEKVRSATASQSPDTINDNSTHLLVGREIEAQGAWTTLMMYLLGITINILLEY